MSVVLITTTGEALPLVCVSNIYERDQETESFLEYKLSCSLFMEGDNYLIVRTIHSEYAQIDVRDMHNSRVLSPLGMLGSEYMYDGTLRNNLYCMWAALVEQGIIDTKPTKD